MFTDTHAFAYTPKPTLVMKTKEKELQSPRRTGVTKMFVYEPSVKDNDFR
jgi:hypothetical protein